MSPDPEPVWLPVANVCQARPYGETHEPRAGLRWLRAGAKVYVPGGYAGPGFYFVSVIGQHRQSRQLFVQDVAAKYLVGWRAKLVYSPTVLRLVAERRFQPICYHDANGKRQPLDGSAEARELATGFAARFAEREVHAHLVGGPCDGHEITLGPGEPATQLLVPVPANPTDGVRYLRRAWDAERAFYDYAPSHRE